MIEAVENHMPQTIIIDEIGTELEALAASTIAQRGVQLVGTAHGTTIESIMKNPYLQILVGGIEVQSCFYLFFSKFLVYDIEWLIN
jgi:stage III sporulation protein SpoIIIAA